MPLTDGQSLTAKDFNTSLTTFTIDGDTLYRATTTSGSGTTYLKNDLTLLTENDEDKEVTIGSTGDRDTPQLAFANDILYAAVGTSIREYRYNPNTKFYDSTSFSIAQNGSDLKLKSVCILGDTLWYSLDGASAEGGLYACDLTTTESKLVLSGSGYGALTSYGGKLYAVKGNGVIEYAVGDGLTPTGYEISAASDSGNRLSNAKESVRAASLLVTADSGNNRLSVYDMDSGSFTVLPLSYSPSMIATDGAVIAAADGSRIHTYTREKDEWREEVFSLAPEDPVRGLACLYGKVYYVSLHYQGIVGEGQILTGGVAPVGIAGDLYGDLFLACEESDSVVVRRYSEQSFLAQGGGEVLPYRLPKGFTSLRSDFEGNLYCLDNAGVLYRNGEAYASVDGKNFVYSESSLYPSSFALGFEDDRVYFGFGNFIVETKAGALGFPSLGTIPAGDVYEELARVHAPEEGAVRHVDVREGTVGIGLDLGALTMESEFFPFSSYGMAKAGRGVLLAESGSYNVVALYDGGVYDVRLFRAEECSPAEVTIAKEEQSAYLSSDCSLYNYPCVTAAKGETLPRGSRIKVLGTVCPDENGADLGYDFAYVEAETNARQLLRGYVPLSFLAEEDPTGIAGDDFEIARLKPSAENIDFVSESGDVIRLPAGTVVKVYRGEDGSLTACYADESGTEYFAAVAESDLERGESDALRISLIVILSVLALLIVGAYFFLLPRQKKIPKNG